MDIAAWPRELGLERYVEAFEANDIDAAILHKLNADDLKELGVTSLGHRKKLLEAIATLAGPTSRPMTAPAEAPRAAPAREAERRQLTVMFVDLVGSTALSARLDPEDMREVLRAYQDACAGVIARFEGFVAKFMGDGVLAYFGYPRAHEDEAERATRAGLALVKTIGGLKANGEALAARVGIATGLVVVGDLIGEGAAQEQVVVGETPNLAARLQALAAAGQVVIAEPTRRLLGASFELEDLGEHDLKGMDRPVNAFAVAGERRVESRFEARSGLALLPMVGRDQELALLLDRWAQAKASEGQGVLLVGEAGIGKSRISRALLDAVANEPHIRVRYQCSPYHADSPLWPVIQQLSHAAGLGADDPVEVRLDKLEALLDRADGRDAAPLIADLLGLDGRARYGSLDLTPQAQRIRTLDALVDQLAGLAARQPVLVVLEDAHWIDPTTFEMIEQGLDRIGAARVLLLLTSRPDNQPSLAAHPHITRLTLNRLGRAGVEGIVARLGGDHLPGETIDAIIARTDGVPLFVEELTKAVLETGEASIPASLHDSLMARLDRTPEIKEVAQIAACIGREFDFALLVAIADRPGPTVQSSLDRLTASELVSRRGVPPAATYSFKHALVQDTAYQSLLKSRRQQLHARIAESLEKQFSDIAHGEPEVLAHHYTQADLVPRAIPYWLDAGRRTAERSADREAAAHLTKGLELVAHLPDPLERAARELDLRIALGPVLMNIKGSAAPVVAEVYERAHELCGEVGRPEQTFPVLWGLWFHHCMRGQLRVAREYANGLIEVAEELPETVFRLQGHHAAWTTRCELGEFPLAQEHIDQGLRVYDVNRHPPSAFVYGGHDAGVCGYSNGALISWMLGYPDRAVKLAEEGVALARRLDQPFSTAQALCYKAILHQLRGEPEPVVEYASELLALCAKHDLKAWSHNARILEGWTLLLNGVVEEGLRQFRQALDARRATKVTTRRQAYYLALLAERLGALGQPEQGIDAVSEAVELTNSTEDRRWEALVHRVRGDLLVAASGGNEADAEAAFRCAIAIARKQEAKSLELRAATSLVRLLAEQGDKQSARDLLAPVYGWFTEGFDTADLTEAKALLASLS